MSEDLDDQWLYGSTGKSSWRRWPQLYVVIVVFGFYAPEDLQNPIKGGRAGSIKENGNGMNAER